MARISAVIFDKDGTLFDFRATWSAWVRSFVTDLAGGDRQRAATLAARIGYDIGTGSFAASSVVVAGTPWAIADRLLPALSGITRAELLTRMARSTARAPQVPAVPLVPCLDALRARGLALGVVTNDAEAAAGAHLQAAGIAGHFDMLAGYDSGHGEKPGPGALLAFARATGRAPSQVVMVGDSRADLLAAQAAGMPAVAVLTGLAAESELAPLACAVLHDIGHLAGWLDARS